LVVSVAQDATSSFETCRRFGRFFVPFV